MTPARQQIHPAFARAAALDARQPAPAFLVVPPSGFSASYRKKPIAPIKVGLRLLSEEESSEAMIHAQRDATRPDLTEDTWAEFYNSAVMSHVLAVACCEAADASQSYFREVPNHAIREAFTPATIRALWQKFEVLSLSSSPLTPEIDDEGGAELAAMLSRDVLLIAKPETRRLLHVALMELRGAIDAPDEPDPEEPAPAAPAYVAASAGA